MIRFARVLVLLSATLLGCSALESPKEIRYYTLQPDFSQNAAFSASPNARVTHVAVSTFLAQPGIILENTDSTLNVAYYHLWAELPDVAIKRYLDQCVRQQVLPQHKNNLELSVEIHQFHRLASADVTVSGYWRAYDPKSTRLVKEHHFELKRPQTQDGYHAVVDALSLSLEDLCQQIRQTLKATPPRRD